MRKPVQTILQWIGTVTVVCVIGGASVYYILRDVVPKPPPFPTYGQYLIDGVVASNIVQVFTSPNHLATPPPTPDRVDATANELRATELTLAAAEMNLAALAKEHQHAESEIAAMRQSIAKAGTGTQSYGLSVDGLTPQQRVANRQQEVDRMAAERAKQDLMIAELRQRRDKLTRTQSELDAHLGKTASDLAAYLANVRRQASSLTIADIEKSATEFGRRIATSEAR
jgi:predicted  nucleic acid-binding Zn-ribbon protein